MWNGLDSTKEHMYASGFAAGTRRPRHLHPHGRLPRQRRGAAAARPDRPGVHGGLGGRLRRPSAGPWRRRPGSGSSAGPSAATTRRAPPRSSSGSRCASRGAPTTTGARCRNAAWNARARTRCRTTGTTSCGCGASPMWTRSSTGPRRSTSTAWSSGSPCRSSSRTARTTGRSRCTTRTAPTSRRSTARAGSCGSSPRPRAAPSTSAWTTCRTSSVFIADWIADVFGAPEATA